MKPICRNRKAGYRSRCINKRKNGGGLILTMILVFVIITFVVMIGEFYRIHILQQDIEYQLQRTVNCAVEYAMGDSYRQDKIINLNITTARQEFFTYLGEDVGLDSYNRKYKDGRLVYALYFSSIGGTSNPAEFTVKGYAEANSVFSFLAGKISIPFEISSTNFRTE